jgi:hypothetical protein
MANVTKIADVSENALNKKACLQKDKTAMHSTAFVYVPQCQQY